MRVCVCARARVRACVRACACVRADVRVCACVHARTCAWGLGVEEYRIKSGSFGHASRVNLRSRDL
jgi:hypothetical protein